MMTQSKFSKRNKRNGKSWKHGFGMCALPEVLRWSPNSHVPVFGDGPQGKWPRLNDVIKVGAWPHRMGVLIRSNSRALTLPLPMHPQERSHVRTPWRWLSTSPDKRTQEGTSEGDFPASRAMRKLTCIVSTIQSGILLWQLLQTETEAMDKWPLL